MIAAIWELDSEIFESEYEPESGVLILDATLKVIAKVFRDPCHATRISVINIVFGLLNSLAQKKSPHSASLYKLFTFLFIENYDDELTREAMCYDYIELFGKHKSIPVQILLTPLLRKLR